MSHVGSCCPHCLADWTEENNDIITVMEGEGPTTLECVLHESVLVAPEDVSVTLLHCCHTVTHRVTQITVTLLHTQLHIVTQFLC